MRKDRDSTAIVYRVCLPSLAREKEHVVTGGTEVERDAVHQEPGDPGGFSAGLGVTLASRMGKAKSGVVPLGPGPPPIPTPVWKPV